MARPTTLDTLEKRYRAAIIECTRLKDAIDLITEIEAPKRAKQITHKVNGALSAFASGTVDVVEQPLSSALHALLTTEGPLSAKEIEARLRASYTGPAKITNSSIGGRLTQMRHKGIVTNTDAGWAATGKPLGKAGNQGGPRKRRSSTTSGGKRPAGERHIDVVMRALLDDGVPMKLETLRQKLPTGTPISTTLSTGLRWGRLQHTGKGWALTLKGRKEAQQQKQQAHRAQTT